VAAPGDRESDRGADRPDLGRGRPHDRGHADTDRRADDGCPSGDPSTPHHAPGRATARDYDGGAAADHDDPADHDDDHNDHNDHHHDDDHDATPGCAGAGSGGRALTRALGISGPDIGPP
jgi:hypothetical protein